ncbi:unnamed protein product [Anisakis simplex]|uniref:Sorbitol dehydrogenase n=1 Tax=Anisakis simplex TaxID=6269 RepID=A0A0M3K6G4_ANISI|nr:unnamed protein product [Anisakis simplex]
MCESNCNNNLCAVLHGKDDIRMEGREVPKPKPNQLLIKIHTVGICGTDVHYWKHAKIGEFTVTKPMVLGHESSGTVAAVGSDVKGFSIGDRVALEPGVACRVCMACKTGKYNVCDDVRFFANPPYDGSLARYVVHDADFCFRLPDNVTMEEGSMAEPLSVGVHACRRAEVSIAQKILILGAGPIGLVNMVCAKAMGASQVIMTDICDSRLELAKKLGADRTLNVNGMSASAASEAIIVSLGQRPDAHHDQCYLVTYCTELILKNNRSIRKTCVILHKSAANYLNRIKFYVVKRGGILVLVGLGGHHAQLFYTEAAMREIDIRGAFRYVNCFPTAIELISSGKVDLSGFTRAHYKLEESVEAFQRSLKGDVVKVFIHCDDATE